MCPEHMCMCVCPKWSVHDAEMCAGKMLDTFSWQLTVPPASRRRPDFFSHTYVNYSRVASHKLLDVSRVPCVVRNVFGGTPHDPTVLVQDPFPEFVSISAGCDTGPKTPRSNPYIGL